jgi:uncharacterized protein
MKRSLAMRILRILVATLFVIVGTAQRAPADDAPSPEALQAASELMSIMSPDMVNQLIGQMLAAFWPPVEQRARADNIDPATVADMRKEIERITHAYVNDVMKEAPPIYAKHFTVAELHDITAFYRTPTGVKSLHELPKVMGEFSVQMMPHLQDLKVQIGEAINNVLHQHGYPK